MANPFVKTKTTILFDGWVLMVNGAADFIFYFLLKRGLKAAAEKQEQESEENTEKTEEIKETAEEIPEWREDSYRENKVPDTVTEMTLTETPEKTERNAYEEEERKSAERRTAGRNSGGVERLKNKVVLVDFSGVYREENFWKEEEVQWLSAQDIPGTNCYCDDEAWEILQKRMEAFSFEGIHFLDSGIIII